MTLRPQRRAHAAQADAAVNDSTGVTHDIDLDPTLVLPEGFRPGETRPNGAGPDDPATGELDLEDRQALRRVAGFSTELTDISEVEYRRLQLERVVLVGVWTEGSVDDAENSLRELKLLAETAGAEVLEGLIQRRSRPDQSAPRSRCRAPTP